MRVDLGAVLPTHTHLAIGEDDGDAIEFCLELEHHALPIAIDDVVLVGAGNSATTNSLRTQFNSIDGDGSGTITGAELKLALQKVSPNTTDGEVEELLKRADTDGNNEIDFIEFARSMGGGLTRKARLGRWNFALDVDWRQGDVEKVLEAGTFADVAVGSAGLAKADDSGAPSIAARLCSSERAEVRLKVRSRPLLPVDPSTRRGVETNYDMSDGTGEDSGDEVGSRGTAVGGNHARGGGSTGEGAASVEVPPPKYDPFEGQLTGRSLLCFKTTFPFRIWVGRFLTGSLRGSPCLARWSKLIVGQHITIDVRVDAEVIVVVKARIIAKHRETDTFDIFIPVETDRDEADATDASEDEFGATPVGDDSLRLHASELLELESGKTPPKEFKVRCSFLLFALFFCLLIYSFVCSIKGACLDDKASPSAVLLPSG